MVGGLFPNDADGNAWGDPKRGLPPAAGQGRLQAASIPAATSSMNNDFTSQISAFKSGRRRDRHRQHDPARLRDLLVAGGAAGLQAEDRHHRQGAAVPIGDRLARRARQRPHDARSGGRRTIRSSPASPARARDELTDAYIKATNRPWTQPIGFQHALFEVAIDVLKRAQNLGDPKSILDAIVADQLQSIVGPVHWTGAAGEERHQDAARRRPMAAQGRQVRARHHRKTRPRRKIPVGGKLEPIS